MEAVRPVPGSEVQMVGGEPDAVPAAERREPGGLDESAVHGFEKSGPDAVTGQRSRWRSSCNAGWHEDEYAEDSRQDEQAHNGRCPYLQPDPPPPHGGGAPYHSSGNLLLFETQTKPQTVAPPRNESPDRLGGLRSVSISLDESPAGQREAETDYLSAARATYPKREAAVADENSLKYGAVAYAPRRGNFMVMEAISVEAAIEKARRKGLKPGRVRGTDGIQFTRGRSDRIETISWEEFRETLARRNLQVMESGGFMKIMKKD